jgi:putative cell wall-binding protein
MVVAVAAVGGGSAAYASHASSPVSLGGTLTASNGSSSIFVSGSTSIAPEVCDINGNCVAATVSDAQWSADGSRVVFVNQNQQIETTVRNVKDYEWWTSTPANGTQRKSPTFDSTGEFLIWSERANATSPWSLVYAGAASSMADSSYPWFSDATYNYTNPDAGSNGKVVYQRNTNSGGVLTGTPEVWLGDFNTGSTQQLLTDASQPAVMDDKVAFVRSDGAHQQIFVATYDDGGVGRVTQLTSDAVDHANPTFSPDGTDIAFNLPDGTVGLVAVAGDSMRTVSGLHGVPAYQTRAQDTVYRISGVNRYATAVQASKAHWVDGSAASVVLSRSDDFADALGGSALAAAKHGPLLLTPPTSLNSRTGDEIKRVLSVNPDAKVYLLGGTGAISTEVENAVKALGYQTVRLGGATRYDTSLAIANEISTAPHLILAATGKNFPDALAAGAAAGEWTSLGYPGVVILTNNGTLPAATRTYLNNNAQADLAAIGGQAVTALSNYPNTIQVVGSTRYQTAAFVAQVFFGGSRYAGLATGTDWPDALAGGALLGTLGGPLLLTNGKGTNLDANTAWVLSDRSASISNPLVFGGAGVVTDALANQAGGWASPVYTVAANPLGLPRDSSVGGPTDTSPPTKPLAKVKAKLAPKLTPKLGKTDSLNRR